MNKDSRTYVAGHTGLVGSAVVRELKSKGYDNIIYSGSMVTNLISYKDTHKYFYNLNPEYVINCAAHAGGIQEAINNPAGMLIDNIRIQTNIIECCHDFGVKKLLNLASSCIYPVDAPQPYKEEQLGTGKTDENWSYAIAKLAGIELCRAYHRQYNCNFITAVPCNLYGPGDNFDPDKSHVIPALIRKFHESNGGPIEIWGNGKARREFLYVDDFAEAAVMLMEKYDYNDLCDGAINIGIGKDITIDELTRLVSKTVAKVEYHKLFHVFKENKPNGVPSKLMDSSRIHDLGWKAETSLEEGIRKTYEWYKENLQ